MHIPKRILRLARDRALSSFSVLAEQTVVEAETQATRAMSIVPPSELPRLQTIRTFLHGEGRTLRTRMDRHFGGLLERSMQTMHVDLRSAAGEINYATLTLIDDDVVVRQIEVDRMVARLRDAETVALGRVNLTIAMMHNDHQARERENPFRPYLLARALYEALRELMWDEAHSKQLFDALGQAMANRLPGFYGGILEVFEAGGITARLSARPAAMSRAERERRAWQSAASQLQPGRVTGAGPGGGHGHGSEAQLVPALQRLKDLQRGDGGLATRELDLIDTVWNLFHQPKSARLARKHARVSDSDERSALDALLLDLQRSIAAGAQPPAPLTLRELIGNTPIDAEQKRTLEVLALLFESLVHDDLLGAPTQRHLARLFVPFVRAALMEPELLHDPSLHARRLIDRLGSVALGIGPGHPGYSALEPHLDAVVGAVLDLFDDDMQLFADAESALNAHVTSVLAELDPRLVQGSEAIAEAATASARLAIAGAALGTALQPLQIAAPLLSVPAPWRAGTGWPPCRSRALASTIRRPAPAGADRPHRPAPAPGPRPRRPVAHCAGAWWPAACAPAGARDGLPGSASSLAWLARRSRAPVARRPTAAGWAYGRARPAIPSGSIRARRRSCLRHARASPGHTTR